MSNQGKRIRLPSDELDHGPADANVRTESRAVFRVDDLRPAASAWHCPSNDCYWLELSLG